MQQLYIDLLKRREQKLEELAEIDRECRQVWRQFRRELGPKGQELDPIIGMGRVDAMTVGRMLALGLEPLFEVGRAGGVVGPEWIEKIEEQINRITPAASDVA